MRKLVLGGTLPSWNIHHFSILSTIYRKICNNIVAKYLPKIGLCLELPTGKFISQCVMPENPLPATQPDSAAEPGELNFAKSSPENPRIKRRTLKAKPSASPKLDTALPSATREPEQEAPSFPSEKAKAVATPKSPERISPALAAKTAEPAATPPRAASSAATHSSPSTAGIAIPKVKATPTSRAPSSPHGTRPATLYYSSYARKDKEAPSPMKTTPTASPASSSSATTVPPSAARPAATAPRAAAPVDYRANVERQHREQKSVGNILSYVVYGFIALFVLGAILAGYGANVIFKQIHDQSVTVNDLDQKYAKVTTDLNAKLVATQETLKDAQAQNVRQQDLIVKQQDSINRLMADSNDTINALKLEKQTRTQETATLRSRLREVEYKASTNAQKY
jgi:hypothetical protein